MNQKEFNKYSKKIQAEVNKTLNNYDGLMARVRSGEINEDNWSTY